MTAVADDDQKRTGRPAVGPAAAGPSAPVIAVENASKRFVTRNGGAVALEDVSLEVRASEFAVLLGPSGSGKTTLLRCIAGFERLDEGEIYVGGKLVYSARRRIDVPPERRMLGMVFQSYALWPHMSVLRNVMYPLRARRVARKPTAERAQRALDTVSCGELGDRYPYEISGGQQQRVALARAMVSAGAAILFDEPLSNVDAKVRAELRTEIKRAHETLKLASVYVTHDQAEAFALADRVILMSHGRIVQAGDPATIYREPATRFAAEFVGDAVMLGCECLGPTEDDCLRFSTAIGEIVCRMPAASAPAQGARGSLVVRPHACQVGGLSDHDGDTPDAWIGVVEDSRYQGGHFEVSVRVQDVLLLAVMPFTRLIESLCPGDRVRVTIDPTELAFVAE